jgi:hypothetical protein
MASAELSRRVEKVVGYPPLYDMDALHGRESTRPYLTPPPSTICPASVLDVRGPQTARRRG